MRRLAARGLVDVLPRHLPNGGQLENGFRVTPAGAAFLQEKGASSPSSAPVPAETRERKARERSDAAEGTPARRG